MFLILGLFFFPYVTPSKAFQFFLPEARALNTFNLAGLGDIFAGKRWNSANHHELITAMKFKKTC